MKRYDLMHNINIRGTFLVSKVCLPYLKRSHNPHIVNISPPLSMKPIWFKNHVAYTMSKYGMSMCVLGMAEEFKGDGIAVNAVWPKTAIYTAAIEVLSGPDSSNYSRKPEIMGDAVYSLICKDSKSVTGKFLIDEELLKSEGITDFTNYACNPANKNNLMLDFFLEDNLAELSLQGQLENSYSQKKTESIQDSSKSNLKIEQVFTAIEANLSNELVNKTGAVFQFNVKGDEAGTWYLDLKTGKGSMGKGEPSQPPDATLTMDSQNFFAMFTGKLKPTSAFMMGKLRIQGNLQKAMKLEKLMQSLKSKL
ncbi:PREDICTED: hydroxysteroid dehydrogenase-like protein 2 [Dufourea novaeangliae]|uniref:Hydroxysteroid dehydrogenase-like protein 2 n=1 Tax=Dufourea novaeangliae TaxID=178035 RepID=A0A154PUE9_DUFNO|nr:PREDICTED: hydroxysteroid dehydrogenase-like protein 2 [Dufourea novaeangliae]KZC15064.1 Hydroxysteroid dehydrogenase-like protein 2 [Dufourea novaeangliae]